MAFATPPLFNPSPSGAMTENGMLRFVFTRLEFVVPTFIGITLLVFVLIRLIPGDPIETMAGERGIDPARLAQLRKDYGFDQPVLVQYGLYLSRLAAWRPRPLDRHP